MKAIIFDATRPRGIGSAKCQTRRRRRPKPLSRSKLSRSTSAMSLRWLGESPATYRGGMRLAWLFVPLLTGRGQRQVLA